MKRYAHLLFYLAATIATVGMFARWEWIQGTFDGWFPLVMILSGQLARIRSNAPETWIDRSFKSRKAERAAILSIVAVLLGITLWAAYLKYIWMPWNDRMAVQEYLEAREKLRK